MVLAITLAILSSLLTITSQEAHAQSSDCSPTNFVDVPAGQYYSEAIAWAECNGITNGTSATTFSPDAVVSRAQMATFLWRYAGEPAAEGQPFADVPPGSYYDTPAAWFFEEEITGGTLFSPLSTVTRGQVATFLWRYADRPAVTTSSPFTDVPAGVYYTDPVAWMYDNGVTTGTSATAFSPDHAVTRAELVTFLWRLSLDHQRLAGVEQILDAFDLHHAINGTYALSDPIGIDHGQGRFQYTDDGAYPTSIADTLIDGEYLPADYLTDPLDTNKDHYLREGRDFLIFRCDPGGDEPGAVAVFVKTIAEQPSEEAQQWWDQNDCEDFALENGYNHFRVSIPPSSLAFECDCAGPVGFWRRM